MDLNLPAYNALWGAEVAAQRLTGYLQPEHFTLYVRGDDKPLLTAARMRLYLNGNSIRARGRKSIMNAARLN